MQKNIFISLVIVALGTAGIWFALSRNVGRITVPLQVLTVSEKKEGPLLANGSPLYTISYEIPTGLPGAEKLLLDQKQQIADLVWMPEDQVIERTKSYNELGVPGGDENSDTVTVAGLSPNHKYITYAVESYEYNAGAAHPNTLFTYRTFDKTGLEYTFDMIFNDHQRALDALSTSVRSTLLSDSGKDGYTFSADDSWFIEGTSGTDDNFASASLVAPLEDGLHVILNQYQIGPYVLGNFDVAVPYSDPGIKSVLNPIFTR